MTEKRKMKTAQKAVETDQIIWERFTADSAFGLTEEQVKLHWKQHATNEKVDPSTKSLGKIIKTNVLTYFNLIFLVIAILLIAVGSFRDLAFLPIILANTVIGIVQEIRSKQVLDQLSILNEPKIQVLREGVKKRLPAEELVLDDLVILSAGNQIPADAIVVDGEVSVNESLLTGEAEEVKKGEKEELLSGSYVLSGSCIARLEKVGKESYISKLTLQATKEKEGEQSEMIRSLDSLVKVIGIIVLPISALLFVQQFFYANASFKDSVTGMVAAVIGMIPEGLYLLASVAMAVSALRLADQQVLLHDMKCIETLARVDVLCVDKTGTITVPDMELDQIMVLEDQPKRVVERILVRFVKEMTADNATMEALKKYFQVENEAEEEQVQIGAIYSFSSTYKYSAMELEGKSYVLGAPEFVLRADYTSHTKQIEPYSKKGHRILVFGCYQGKLDGKQLLGKVQPLCYLFLTNQIRKGAVDTFTYFAKRGVKVLVISGDHPKTVSEIAGKAGIEHASDYVDAATLKTPEQIGKAVGKYTVFGRVTPEQKRLLIQALKEEGKTVAMTGDGVNDVLALKDADCSIAMASGSEAAAQVAQLVLLDSDFSKMPAVVMEGRRVVNNIERTASLYLVKNIFSMLLAIFSVLLMLDYPLEPSQVSLISLFTIGIPSFVLALEPNSKQIQGHFLSNVLLKALPAGITNFLVVSGLVLYSREFRIDVVCISTSCTIIVTIVGFLILYEIAKPMTKGHRILMGSVIAGWLFCIIFISPLFAIKGITKQCAMLMVLFAILTEPLLRYLSKLTAFLAAFVKQQRNLKKDIGCSK